MIEDALGNNMVFDSGCVLNCGSKEELLHAGESLQQSLSIALARLKAGVCW